MKNDAAITQTNPQPVGIVHFFRKLGSKITSLFEPEEVEVTFKVKGNRINYTYTKVPHKQVA